MKVRSILFGAMALGAVALAPTKASAQCAVGATYSTNGPGGVGSLGLGAFLQGCFTATIQELGENAGATSRQFYWTNFTAAPTFGVNNIVTTGPAGTEFFNDDCGSTGSLSFTTFAFCPVDAAHTVTGIFNPSGEFVLGLLAPDLPFPFPLQNGGTPYWLYSGASSRNLSPAPAGFQAVLMQLTTAGVPQVGRYLFAWEDINSGCAHESPAQNFFRTEDLGSQVVLDDGGLHACDVFNGTTPSDNDFNDSYILLTVIGQPLQTGVPEPMTMTLMATGLVGLAGSSLRRRKNKN
jgi:hypothetical protein